MTVVVGVSGVLTPGDVWAVLGNPGLWVPVFLLVVGITVVLWMRRAFRREPLALDPGRITSQPPAVRRLVQGARARTLAFDEIQRVRTVPGRRGVSLVLHPTADDAPLGVPLQHAGAGPLCQALRDRVPRARWEDDPWERLASFPEDAAAAARLPVADEDAALRYYLAAGLWHLAAERTWPAVLDRPDALAAARRLYEGERQRLPNAPRLRLARALYRRHPEELLFGLDAARLALIYRLRDDAMAVLDALVARDDCGAVAPFWRTTLRERRALPAPGSKATFGIEVNLPSHELEADVLVVEGRYRVPLSWFLGYRLVPGFWAPVRAVELWDLWSGRHLLQGDPLAWVAWLTAAAPHLTELHDEGLIWPPVGGRIRQVSRGPGAGV